MKNKIILDNEILSLDTTEINYLEVKGNSTLNLYNNSLSNLEINIEDNSALIINCFRLIDNAETKIKINANYKSSIIFNYAFINDKKHNLNINTNFLSEESNITINISALNNGGMLLINVDGYVNAEKFNNILDENIRIINQNNGKVISNPNMYISASKVIANHNTTIGNVREDELFYLMSKGLNKSEATKLITDGFLVKTITDNEMKIKIKEELNRR